jgi:hypothetical protein
MTIDPLLLPFLREREEVEARRLLGELIGAEAEPLVGAIVHRRLGAAPEREDVCGQVRLRLVSALQELRASGGAQAIEDFRGYVAAVAAHACDDVLRERYPQRQRLRNQLRYLLSHDSTFAISRDTEGRWQCRLNGHAKPAGPRGASWFADPRAYLRGVLADGPVELDELVRLAANAAGVKVEPAFAPLDERLSASDARIAERLDQRRLLERLWREIGLLPVRQRVALLLNLRDAGTPDVISVFPVAGVASLQQIAGALEMPVSELAGLWNDLPLDDHRLAARLGLTRQQVINLRSAARARLARRLRERIS